MVLDRLDLEGFYLVFYWILKAVKEDYHLVDEGLSEHVIFELKAQQRKLLQVFWVTTHNLGILFVNERKRILLETVEERLNLNKNLEKLRNWLLKLSNCLLDADLLAAL